MFSLSWRLLALPPETLQSNARLNEPALPLLYAHLTSGFAAFLPCPLLSVRIASFCR